MDHLDELLVCEIIVFIRKLGVAQMRGNAKSVGITQISCCRIEIVNWCLSCYSLDARVKSAFYDFKAYNRLYPSDKEATLLVQQIQSRSGVRDLTRG